MENTTNPPVLPENSAKKKHSKGIPAADSNFLSLAKSVADKWNASPEMVLRWTNTAAFAVEVTGFETSLYTRKTTGGDRSAITSQLTLLNKLVDSGIEYVKAYLVEKYTKKNAPAYYAEFGIVKNGSVYKLPNDHQKRKDALAHLVAAIAVEGFQNKTYGSDYWADVKTKFDALIGSAGNADSTVSHQVGLKNQHKVAIRKVMNALIHLIYAQYPETAKAEVRTWGFRKERY